MSLPCGLVNLDLEPDPWSVTACLTHNLRQVSPSLSFPIHQMDCCNYTVSHCALQGQLGVND